MCAMLHPVMPRLQRPWLHLQVKHRVQAMSEAKGCLSGDPAQTFMSASKFCAVHAR